MGNEVDLFLPSKVKFFILCKMMLSQGPAKKLPIFGVLLPIRSVHFFILALSGSTLLVFDPILLRHFNTNSFIFAVTLMGVSGMGLSHRLSLYLNEPKYDLWLKILSFTASHPTFVLSISPGLIMGNLEIMTLGATLGCYASESPHVRKFEKESLIFLNDAKELLTKDNAKQVVAYCRQGLYQNKGRCMSLAIGASTGLVLYTYAAPFIDPITTNLGPAGYQLITFPGSFISNYVTGGYLIHALLHCAGLGYMAYNSAFPLIVLTGTSSWLSYQSWEICRETAFWVSQKTQSGFQQCKDYVQHKFKQIQSFFSFSTSQTAKETPTLKHDCTAPLTEPYSRFDNAFLLIFRHQTRDIKDYPGMEETTRFTPYERLVP